ncbi:MAG: 50S ribosomal protein L23 [Candidatus Diapherotrites archaeon]|nr:50S ribosomal protein L23 [Candidatus Diapherotrites archaeon]
MVLKAKPVKKPVLAKKASAKTAQKPVAKKRLPKHAQAQARAKEKTQSKPPLEAASASQQLADLTDILFYPLITEKAVGMIEKENKLAFIVSDRADKASVKKAVQDVYAVKVLDVNLIRDRKGRKKAFVRLDKAFKASDVAIKLGVI